MDINWTKNILLNNFETPELNINCTYADPGNNIIVIDEMQRLYSNLGLNTYGFAIACVSKIAKQYGITVANIVSMNKSTYPTISAGFIRVGWKLRVK